jgi:hypothetical protein
MKAIIILMSLLVSTTVIAGDLVEYKSASGKPALYSRQCYDTTLNKIVKSADGEYLIEVAVTKDDCRVSGTFAKVQTYVRNLDYGTWSIFTSEWMITGKAEARKQKLDATYKNTLGLWCPSQRIEVVRQYF